MYRLLLPSLATLRQAGTGAASLMLLAAPVHAAAGVEQIPMPGPVQHGKGVALPVQTADPGEVALPTSSPVQYEYGVPGPVHSQLLPMLQS